MRHATRVIGYTLYLLLAACAKTHEPKTTQEQEAAFQQTFGFPAPETITEIKYFALSNRGFVDAAYGIRVRCTYDEAIFNRILKQGKFRENRNLHLADQDATPAWWPKNTTTGTVIYTTPEKERTDEESFSSRSYLWRGSRKRFFHFHTFYSR